MCSPSASLPSNRVDVKQMQARLRACAVYNSLTTAQLKPVYWRRAGKPIPVMRAHWMFDQVRPGARSNNAPRADGLALGAPGPRTAQHPDRTGVSARTTAVSFATSS